jgi:hypothetical protein
VRRTTSANGTAGTGSFARAESAEYGDADGLPTWNLSFPGCSQTTAGLTQSKSGSTSKRPRSSRPGQGGPPVQTRVAPLLGTIRAGWACSTAVSAGDSSIMVPSRGNARSGRDEFRETFEPHACMSAHGNPEPSRRGTVGRCRDYLRARSALNNRQEHPAPTRTQCAGEEIVHSRRKRRGK